MDAGNAKDLTTASTGGGTKKSSARKLSVRKKSSARATSRASGTTSSGGTVNAIVVSDTYGHHEISNDPTTPRFEAFKGDKLSVSKAEFERGSTTNPPGLAKVGSDEAKDAAEGKTPEPPLTKPDGHPVDPDLDDLTA